jgi:pyruvate carboxylase subunit B
MIDKDTWNMILGRMGKLPGALAPEIEQLAEQKGLEFYTGDPQSEFPDELDRFRQIMKEEGWDCGQDDEELFELAMHERQYRDYRSGVAKERFNKDLEAARAKAGAPVIIERPVVEMPKYDIDRILEKYPDAVPVQTSARGQMLWQIDVDDASSAPAAGTEVKAGAPVGYVQTYYGMEEVTAAVDGRIVAVCAAQGDNVVKGEIVAFIQA